MIDRLQSHYGFTKMPFGRDLAPSMPHKHQSHAEAVARITWCVKQRVLGVVTGEVGAGKTVAVRAALAALDPVRHTINNLAIQALIAAFAEGKGMVDESATRAAIAEVMAE